MTLIRTIVGFLITIAVLVFAAANLHTIEVYYTPFTPALELPLFIVALGLMSFGFVIGSMMVWINEGKARRERCRQRKEISKLQKELEETHAPNDSDASPSDFFPALPKAFKK